MSRRLVGRTLSRRFIFSLSAGASALAVATALRHPWFASPTLAQPRPPTPDQALQRLLEGNRRFAAGAKPQADISGARRTELADGQRPFATIVSCADSRVPTEIIFDQGLGDLFVCRIAGNVVDVGVAGSVEYAVGVLGVSLIFVTGHASCGAVKAAVDAVKGGGPISPNIDVLVDAIRAPVLRVIDRPGDTLANATAENVRFGMDRLAAEPDLMPFLASGQLAVAGGVYDLNSGLVELVET